MAKRGRPCDMQRMVLSAARDQSQRTIAFAKILTLSPRGNSTQVSHIASHSVVAAEVKPPTPIVVLESDEECCVIGEGPAIAEALPCKGAPASLLPSRSTSSLSPAVTCPVKRRRGTYSKACIAEVQRVYNTIGTFKGTVRALRTTPGYQHIDRKQVKNLISCKVRCKGGRKVNPVFDDEVRNGLLVEIFEFNTVDSVDKAHRVASIAFSREFIVRAAKRVAAQERWAKEASIQNCKFSIGWVTNWLRRIGVSRRRITTVTKVVDSAQVNAVMSRIQQVSSCLLTSNCVL
jgi:hypothetical protein